MHIGDSSIRLWVLLVGRDLVNKMTRIQQHIEHILNNME